jgi:queuosine precursor transporter
MNIAIWFRPAPSDFIHESIRQIFALMPRIAAASLAAYGVSQLHDVWAYNFWKEKRPGKGWIWLRNNASTMVSQMIDTIIFTLAAFAGVFPSGVLLQIVVSTYLLKLITAAADTPFIYLARSWKERGIVS